jgi:cytochrome c biogenesis protein CcdA
LNETLLWLLYAVSGGVAFAAVYYRRWRISLAVITGGLITVIGWLLLFRFTDEEKRPAWIRLDLTLNLTFGLILAALGAGLGWWLMSRPEKPD